MREPTTPASTLVGRSKSSLSKLTDPSIRREDGVRRRTRRQLQARLLQGNCGQMMTTDLSLGLNLLRSKAYSGYLPATTPLSKEAYAQDIRDKPDDPGFLDSRRSQKGHPTIGRSHPWFFNWCSTNQAWVQSPHTSEKQTPIRSPINHLLEADFRKTG